MAQKARYNSFYIKSVIFKITKKSLNTWARFVGIFATKIAQSGHTGLLVLWTLHLLSVGQWNRKPEESFQNTILFKSLYFNSAVFIRDNSEVLRKLFYACSMLLLLIHFLESLVRRFSLILRRTFQIWRYMDGNERRGMREMTIHDEKRKRTQLVI